MQKNAVEPLFFTIHKKQVKWIKDVHARPETIKVEGNIRESLLDTDLGNNFLVLYTTS
jgi:hypothetical protein